MSSAGAISKATEVLDTPLEKWLEGHHIPITDKREGKKYHAFVFGGFPVGRRRDEGIYDALIQVPVFIVVLKFRTSIDTSTLDADVGLSIGVPLFGDVEIGEKQGNMRDGIIFSLDVPLVASGSVTIFINSDDWFHVKLSLNVVGQDFDADLALFPIPW
ncbi:hypothetical protein L226DRAFT_254870 [Lentinus tigrinus ALCF2SS1-7]|uniref:uncharacterized protein n=1 Tax=Lentinus tigrinus ALCF2SS1-7 TaxID=1328758 RepID=UPI001165FF39|nr:hypothetical protein L226DRAFT_254870 [Lentinus tigrinus ALCF2SS1-7]